MKEHFERKQITGLLIVISLLESALEIVVRIIAIKQQLYSRKLRVLKFLAILEMKIVSKENS